MKFYKISDSKWRIGEYDVPAGTCNIRVDFEGKISIYSLSGATLVLNAMVTDLLKESGLPYTSLKEFEDANLGIFGSGGIDSTVTGLQIPDNLIFTDDANRDTYFSPHRLNELLPGTTVISNKLILRWAALTPSTSAGYSATNWLTVTGNSLTSGLIKSLYEANPDTNSLVDSKKEILDHVTYDGSKLIFDKTIQVPPNSVEFGLNTKLHENGGFLEYHTNSLDKNYILLDYENDPQNGTSKPIYYARAARENRFVVQPDDSQLMLNVTTMALGNPAFDREVSRMYLKLLNAVNNLKLMVVVNTKNVADYPAGSWNDSTAPGFNLLSGEQYIDLLNHFSGLTEYNVTLQLKADGPINVLGNGTLPWYALDINRITRKNVALDEDITSMDIDAIPDASFKTKGLKAGLIDGIKVGLVHGDYRVKEHIKDIEFSAPIDLTFDANDESSVNVAINPNAYAPKSVEDEVNRLKTEITPGGTTPTLPVYAWRGKGGPVMPDTTTQKYRAYYIHALLLRSSVVPLLIPAGSPEGTLISILNDDKNDLILLKAPAGETINGTDTEVTCRSNYLYLYVKQGSDWVEAYEGIFPNSVSTLKRKIEAALPNELNTIDEITAQLKDRLHTFREIQTEFNNELHTFDEIQTNLLSDGFAKDYWLGYGYLSSSTVPSDLNWVMLKVNPNLNIITATQGTGDKYFAISIPELFAVLVSNVTLDNNDAEFSEHKVTVNNLNYTVLLLNNQINSAVTHNLKLLFHSQGAVPSGITLDDGVNNVANIKTINLKGGKLENIQSEEVDLVTDLTFVDGNTKSDFTANKVQSLDKSIRIANLNGIADLSKGSSDHNEGILAFLGNDELLNSKSKRAKLYFGDTRVKGGSFVYPDFNKKTFVLLDIDPQDDPNISGGTTFIIALYLEPDPNVNNVLTQDGSIELELVDNNDNPILDTSGNPMGSKIDYKTGETLRKELYIGECLAKAYTEVHMKIKMDFAQEEIIALSSNTCICIQAITKDESSGLALLSFMAYTGYQLSFDTKYYGYNSLNLAQYLLYDESELTFRGSMNFGNDLYLDFKNQAKISIQNYHLVIKDDGVNLPIWSLTKYYDEADTHNLLGKSYKVTVNITDKDNAFSVDMLKYSGTTGNPEHPALEGFINVQPLYSTGWQLVDSMFITEDPVSGDHIQSYTFTVPSDAKRLAIMFRPKNSEIPTTCKLKDFEGDITPWFNKVIIRDSSHINEKYLENHDFYYRTRTYTPSGYAAYRYTCDLIDTKVPIGVVSGGDGKIINDNAWHDAGSTDPLKTQGDYKFLVAGKVESMTYNAACYNETGTINTVQFWLAKVNGDGTFTEVPNSRYATTIESNRTKAKIITSAPFSFEVKANETYRMFMKSDKKDGFYIQSNTDGVALFQSVIEFAEIEDYQKTLSDRILGLEDFITITDSAKLNDCYMELNYNTVTNRPELTAKTR